MSSIENVDGKFKESVEQDANLKALALRSIAQSSLERERSVKNFQSLVKEATSKFLHPLSPKFHVKADKVNFRRVQIVGTNGFDIDGDAEEGCRLLRQALGLRDKYISVGPARPVEGIYNSTSGGLETSNQCGDQFSQDDEPYTVTYDENGKVVQRNQEPIYDPFYQDKVPPSNHSIVCKHGVYMGVLGGDIAGQDHAHGATYSPDSIPTLKQFYEDLQILMGIVFSGPAKSLSYKRLQLLEARFNLHVMLNADAELLAQKRVPHRDFYNIRKVDCHVHHSACMNQKHLLRFIKKKLKQCPNEIVSYRDGLFMTLSEVFTSLRLSAYDLNVDTLDMHADNTFHRFDRFNLKYNPAGQSRLREIFLKTDNLVAGKFLAEITNEVINDLAESKYSMVEWRLSIYGQHVSEWDKLARWFYVNRLAHNNVRWMIQVPRLYSIYKSQGSVDCFQDMIDRIFIPLFEVSVNPEVNLPLHTFLKTIVGFDSVDDESKVEPIQLHHERFLPLPEQWDRIENPPYSYWTYFLWANITSLNSLRASKGLNTFEYRPHCGEAGDTEHMAASFLVADKINHGILLRKAPVLQYLYYLKEIGIAVSPLSNNRLFLDYSKNPFPKYFAQGLNVSLSTDDPLMLHYTKDALLEEYSAAAQVWKLSATDQSEIARNSVLQSGFEARFKKHFLGENCFLQGVPGNSIAHSNVPDIRIAYRHETLQSELQFVKSGGIDAPVKKLEAPYL